MVDLVVRGSDVLSQYTSQPVGNPPNQTVEVTPGALPFEADDIVVFVIPGDIPSDGNPNPNIDPDGDVQTGTQIQNVIVYDSLEDYNNGIAKYTYVGQNPGQTGTFQLDNQTTDVTFKANLSGLVPDGSSAGAPAISQLYVAPRANFQPGETQVFNLIDDEDFNADSDESDAEIGEPGDGDFNVGGLDPELNPELHPNGPVCFTKGTWIRTPHGQVKIEDLKPGDLVETLDHGPQPIRWVGTRRLRPSILQFHPEFTPVTIAAGALGEANPATDLTVSPLHRIMLRNEMASLLYGEEEVLVYAKDLVNDRTIRKADTNHEVIYMHLLFDRHEVIFSNETPSESLQPGGYTMDNIDDASRRELLSIFPELAQHATSWPLVRKVLHQTEAVLLNPA